MAKIRVVMSNNRDFTISNAFYGSQGQMDRVAAEMQGRFLLTKMATIGTDQGPVINVSQISHYSIED